MALRHPGGIWHIQTVSYEQKYLAISSPSTYYPACISLEHSLVHNESVMPVKREEEKPGTLLVLSAILI